MQDYDKKLVKKMAGRAQEAEQAFIELLEPDHPEHYVLTDWKSGYVMVSLLFIIIMTILMQICRRK